MKDFNEGNFSNNAHPEDVDFEERHNQERPGKRSPKMTRLQGEQREITGMNDILRGENDKGFRALFTTYIQILLVTAKGLIGKTRIVEPMQLAQEFFVKLFKMLVTNPERFRATFGTMDERTFESYAKQAVRNAYTDVYRTRFEYQPLNENLIAAEGADGCEMDWSAEGISPYKIRPDHNYEIRDLKEKYLAKLKELPPKHKRIIEMATEGATQKEIALEIGVTVKSVGKRIRNAAASAKNILREMEPESATTIVKCSERDKLSQKGTKDYWGVRHDETSRRSNKNSAKMK